MKIANTLLLSFALLLATGSAWAQDRYQQQRVNLTVQIVSIGQAADDLREVVSQYDATIQNLSLSRGSTNGSANLRVPPEKLAGLVEELSVLGEVINQSQSTNDFTSSSMTYKKNLKTYRSLQSLNLTSSFKTLPPEVRDHAQVEFKNWLNNQVRSAESSLHSYKEQSKYAEIYIQLQIPEEREKQVAMLDIQADAENSEANEPKPAPAPSGPAPEFFVLCLINLAGLWLIYRKLDSGSQVGIND